MKSSIGYLHKTVSIRFKKFLQDSLFLIIVTLTLLFTNFALSSPTFASDVTEQIGISYTLSENYTDVLYEIVFTPINNQTTVLDYYTLTIPQTEISSDAFQCNGRSQNHDIYKQSNYSNITLSLEGYILKPGDNLNCTFKYRISNNNVQIDFPAKYSDGFSTKYVEINYPSTWGELVFSSIKPQENTKIADNYKVTFTNPQITNIRILLGNSIKYKYTISKELINTSDIVMSYEIPVPIATSSQMVSVDFIEPLPQNSYQDIDGNIFLIYDVQPSSKLQINMTGSVMLVENMNTENVSDNASAIVDYWDISSQAELERISLYLKQNLVENKKNYGLYKALYKYVIDRLTPTTQESSSVENPLRGGVESALSRKSSAISEDYVDFLIAVYREYGIPSRMSLGYIYSPSKEDNGYFHSWVEYFDQKTNWRSIDPSLDDLLEGEFFDSNLSDHITIIQRSTNAFNPKLPYFTDDEYNFKLDDTSGDLLSELQIVTNKVTVPAFMPKITSKISFTNVGNTIIKNIDCTRIGINLNQVILPKQSIESNFTIDNKNTESVLCTYTDINNEIDTAYINIEIEMINYWWEKILPTVISILPLIAMSIIIYYFIFRKKQNIKSQK